MKGKTTNPSNDEKKKNNESGRLWFISGMVAVGSIVTGVLVVISRVIVLPFIRKIVDQIEW